MSAALSIHGLVEIQINGGWGNDFTADPKTIWDVGDHLPETGVGSFLPTIVSAPYETVAAAIDILREGPPPGYAGARVVGLHVEGPWISSEWRGAHNPAHLRAPDIAVAREWAQSGLVRLVTMAPELDGAFDVASFLDGAGVVVSAGHSGADFETASKALAGPWRSVTHLFNQMSPFHHRSPGMVGAALLSDRPCGLIADGIHNAPAAVRLAWNALGPDRVVLITDAMAAAGMGRGSYRLGDHEVEVGEEGPRSGPETLAGSTLTMDQAVANLAAWTGATDDQARACASVNPSRLIGLDPAGTER
jgi:N-acetylglucosamine-6-phosphate deacetylase